MPNLEARFRRIRKSCAIFAIVAFSGCGSWVNIATTPKGALVEIDGEQVGTSPVDKELPRSALGKSHRYRVELEGYEPQEGHIKTRTSPGRIIGTVLTAGIFLIFSSPQYFEPVSVALEPINLSAPRDDGRPMSVGERLQRLMFLHGKGLISDEEYEKHRDEIIRGH